MNRGSTGRKNTLKNVSGLAMKHSLTGHTKTTKLVQNSQ